ncbi:MAG TPA: ZIP family metal transporter [Rhizomicrobium sp.]|nr:ZIP family metal transporter [Rhizomicrobium sp.]
MNAFLVLGVASATCAATMLGGLFALSFKRRVAAVLGFSAGAVLGVAFFDLLPEALSLGGKYYGATPILLAAAAGFLLYGLFDRLVTRHDRPGCGPDPARGFLGAGFFSVHSILDGLGIGFAFQAGHGVGLVVASAVLAHDFADGLNTVNVVVKNGGSRKEALRWLLTDAVAPIAGAGLSLFFTLPAAALALLLAGFSGFFFYIGAVDLLPESQRAGSGARTGLATLLGAAFLFAVTQWAR